ncbi:MAG: YobA family protein [Gemmatimonadetes bacterium]|nr:YobA family protein [Gemmatimonadota bacterium]
MKRIQLPGRAATLAALVAFAGCGGLTFPDETPALRGDIVAIGLNMPFGGARTIWVKEAPESPCGIVFTILPRTDLGERQPDGSVEERVFQDLSVGQTVRVWSGAVAESCPGQAQADALEIELVVEGG